MTVIYDLRTKEAPRRLTNQLANVFYETSNSFSQELLCCCKLESPRNLLQTKPIPHV